MEAETGVLQPQAKGCQELPATTGGQEEAGKDSPLQVSEGEVFCRHFDFGPLTARAMRQYISVVSSTLLWQPYDTNKVFNEQIVHLYLKCSETGAPTLPHFSSTNDVVQDSVEVVGLSKE